MPFKRADDLAQHPDIQALQPFDPYSASRIAHAALVEIKSRCGLWGHTGLPLADIVHWIGLTYGLDPGRCREALVLGAGKRGLHIDDGPNEHIFLAKHFEAERTIFGIAKRLAPRRRNYTGALAKSAKIFEGSVEERRIFFSKIQLECLRGLIECVLAILTGGPGVGKSTLLAALDDHYEDLLVVALSARAGLRAHEIAGVRHTTIARVLRNLHSNWDLRGSYGRAVRNFKANDVNRRAKGTMVFRPFVPLHHVFSPEAVIGSRRRSA